jgi:hypothetical protein
MTGLMEMKMVDKAAYSRAARALENSVGVIVDSARSNQYQYLVLDDLGLYRGTVVVMN